SSSIDGISRKSDIAGLQDCRIAGLQNGRTSHHTSVLSVLQSCNSAILPYYVRRAVAPTHRPSERFWPYADLPEQPTDEELAALDADLREALFGVEARPFSITLVFPALDVPGFARALEIARASAEFREVGRGEDFRYRARFWSSDALHLRDLFDIVGA